MRRVPRVIALALLLALALLPASALAAPLPAYSTPVAALWQPWTWLWGWLFGQAPLPARPRLAPKAAPAQPAGSSSPSAQTDEGPGADPNGG